MKTAKNSSGKPYECKKDWIEDCYLQCGDDGIVLVEGTLSKAFGDNDKASKIVDGVLGKDNELVSYRTAFFEAFPKEPSCFIRGEGKTVEEAEADAYEQYLKIKSCTHEEFDRRGRVDGYAFCKACPYSSMVLDPLTNCTTCGVPAHYSQDLGGNWYCEGHYYKLDVDAAIGPSDGDEENHSLFSVEEKRRSFLRGKAIAEALESLGFVVGKNNYEDINRNLRMRTGQIIMENAFQKENRMSEKEMQEKTNNKSFLQQMINEIVVAIRERSKK